MYTLVTRDRPARRWAAVTSTAILLAAALAAAQALRWYKLTDRLGPLTTEFTCQPGGITLRLPADWQALPEGLDTSTGVVGRFAPGGQTGEPLLTVFHQPNLAGFSYQAAASLLGQIILQRAGVPMPPPSTEFSRTLGPVVATQISGQLVTSRGTNYFTLLASQLPNDHALGLLIESPGGTRGLRTFLARVAEQVTLPGLALQIGPADVALPTVRLTLPKGLQAYLPDGPDGYSAQLCSRAGRAEMRLTLAATWQSPDRGPADLIADIYRDAHLQVVLPGPVEPARFGGRDGWTITRQASGLTRQVAGVSNGSVTAAVIATAPSEDEQQLEQAVRDLLAGVELLALDFDVATALQAGQEAVRQLYSRDPLETWARPGSHYFLVEFPAGGEGIESHDVARTSVSNPSRVDGHDGYLVSFKDDMRSGQTEWSVDLEQLGFRQDSIAVVEFTGDNTLVIRHETTDEQTARGEPVQCTRMKQETGEADQKLDAEWTGHEAFLPDPMEWWAFYLVASGQVDSPALFQRTQYRSPNPGWQLVRRLAATRVTTNLRSSPREVVGVEVVSDHDPLPVRVYFDDDGDLQRYEVGTRLVVLRTSERKFESAERRMRTAGWGRWFERR